MSVEEVDERGIKPSVDAGTYRAYVDILHKELIVATGCTEPIAVAYASALARKVLGCEPERCSIAVSGNIVKNVHSVTVPNTGGLRGIRASVAAGVTVGNSDDVLDVLGSVDDEGRERSRAYLDERDITVSVAETEEPFYIQVTVEAGGSSTQVVMEKSHTNVSYIAKDDEILHDTRAEGVREDEGMRRYLNLADIVAFAHTVDLDDVREVLDRQIDYNYAIAQEGLRGDWGARVGKLYATRYNGDDVLVRAKAAAAAGSDARMSGCPMPVVIVSGSGNQGITASVPVVVYAKEHGKSHDELLRALCISNLVSVYQKMGIGCLSAFCGAVSAGTGAAAAIAYLLGGGMEEIEQTIVNSLGVVSGMVCDGAKPSCAAKIATSVETGLFGYRLFENGNEFVAGDGIVTMGVDETIRNVSRMAREGMRQTDREILDIMIGGER